MGQPYSPVGAGIEETVALTLGCGGGALVLQAVRTAGFRKNVARFAVPILPKTRQTRGLGPQ